MPFKLQKHGSPLTRNNAYLLLQDCEESENFECIKQLQTRILHDGLDTVSALADHLIRLFSRRGILVEANHAFDKVVVPTAHTWAATMSANARLGQGHMAFEFHQRMQLTELKCDKYVYLALLKACTIAISVSQGKLIHSEILKFSLRSDIILGSALVGMYAKCQRLEEASEVFAMLMDRDIVLWNAIIAGYAQHGRSLVALDHLKQMQDQGIKPNVVSWNAAIAGFAQCGSGFWALKCFLKMEEDGVKPNVISWNATITGVAEQGEGTIALELYEKMFEDGMKPSKVTFLSVLKICASMQAIQQGRLIHECIIEGSHHIDVVIGSTLVDMYAKCGSLEEANMVSVKLPERNVVTWSALIAGYAQHGESLLAVDSFHKMQQEGIRPNVVTWNAMILGCAHQADGLLPVDYLEKMQQEGIKPDEITVLNILKACSIIGALQQGRISSVNVMHNGIILNVLMGSALVDMYAKCGSLNEAMAVFENLQHRNVVLWNTMIAGYAQYGEAPSALECFQKMQQESLQPDHISFLAVLMACSHVGLMEEGHWYFKHMEEIHKIVPSVSHCACIADLLARGGCVNEAEELLLKTVQTDAITWRSLLNACKMHGNTKVGSRCFDRIVYLDSRSDAGYVLMSNIFADDDMSEGGGGVFWQIDDV